MANTTRAKILAIAPELSALTYDKNDADNVWNIILVDVIAQITSDVWGNYQEQAQRYLAAHLLTLARPSGARQPLASSPISAIKTGDESISFASKGSKIDQYDLTIYGQKYKEIRSLVVVNFNTYIPSAI